MKRASATTDTASNVSWLDPATAVGVLDSYIPPVAHPTSGSVVSTAIVLEVGAEDKARMRLDSSGSTAWGTLAMVPAPTLAAGDRVVVVVDSEGTPYIVGQLGSKLRLSSDPVTGATKLSSEGSLIVESSNGDVELKGKSARVRATETLQLDAGVGQERSTFTLGGALASLSAKAMKLTAKQADVGIATVSYVGAELRSKLDDAKLTVSRLETAAEQIFERSKEVFRTVDELHQLKAGRARTVVKGGYFVRSGHATIEAAEDMKIDGKQINLG